MTRAFSDQVYAASARSPAQPPDIFGTIWVVGRGSGWFDLPRKCSKQCRLLIMAAILCLPATVHGQSRVDPFDFLEEWDLLNQDFRNGKLELTPEGLPPGFDTDVKKTSEDGHFQVSIRPETDPVPLNEIHTWLVEIKAADGAPVNDADVSFFGGMPLHGHGFPTSPRISGEVEPGVYALEGVKFSMAGWWAIGMGIVAADKTDRIGFNVMFGP